MLSFSGLTWHGHLHIPGVRRSAAQPLLLRMPLPQVDALIAEQGLDLTEEEYTLLIGVCAAEGATWETAAGVLARMSRELTQLQPATLAAVERFFRWALLSNHRHCSKSFTLLQGRLCQMSGQRNVQHGACSVAYCRLLKL